MSCEHPPLLLPPDDCKIIYVDPRWLTWTTLIRMHHNSIAEFWDPITYLFHPIVFIDKRARLYMQASSIVYGFHPFVRSRQPEVSPFPRPFCSTIIIGHWMPRIGQGFMHMPGFIHPRSSNPSGVGVRGVGPLMGIRSFGLTRLDGSQGTRFHSIRTPFVFAPRSFIDVPHYFEQSIPQ